MRIRRCQGRAESLVRPPSRWVTRAPRRRMLSCRTLMHRDDRDANPKTQRRSLTDESRARPERGAAGRGDEPARIRLRVAARGREEGRRRGRERRPVGGRREVCPERVLGHDRRREEGRVRDEHQGLQGSQGQLRVREGPRRTRRPRPRWPARPRRTRPRRTPRSSSPISRPAGRSSRRRPKPPPRASRPTRRRSGRPTARASARRSRPPRASLAADAGAAKAKLAAIPAELDKWEADVTALATPKKDDKKPAAKK